MNQKEVNFLSMCRSVQQVLDTYKTTWWAVPVFVQNVEMFTQLVSELSTAAKGAELRSTGVTEHKLDTEVRAVQLAVNLAKRASVYALDTNNPALHDQLRISRTALIQRPDNLTLSKLRDVYTRLQALAAQLQPYFITETDLNNLNELNNAFEQQISRPRTTIVERKTYNQEHIPEQIAQSAPLPV
ncbi:hypothetical protein [Edaphocola aurantiacus]|uniref:hypothetical protein n=1 Tax=Edaphocola aurantiacus TaxID=2601682 RepID=UPI001C93F8BD|nr:hypothetical protein [Edaphocola aurantiacus]